MIVNCQRDGLLLACQLVGAAVAGTTTKPTLEQVKLIADTDHLVLMATDLEIGIRYELRGVNVQEGGEVLLPPDRLTSLLRESQDSELTLEANESLCRITFGSTDEFEIPTMPAADFPDIPEFSDARYIELQAGLLRDMVHQTVFATSKDSGKFSTHGVLWEVEGKKIRLVATDNKRLACTEGAIEVHGTVETKPQSYLVPTKAMNLLDRNLHDDQEKVRVLLRPNDVLFQTEKSTICSRLLEGRFPLYRKLFGKPSPTKVALPVEAFMVKVRQAAVMTDNETRRVTFQFQAGKLTLQSQSQKTGRSKVELPVEYSGELLRINLDPTYLVEMLRVLDSDAVVTLEMATGDDPAIFRYGDYTYVVMPIE
jgi:DNA polymerase-3 subunit beta